MTVFVKIFQEIGLRKNALSWILADLLGWPITQAQYLLLGIQKEPDMIRLFKKIRQNRRVMLWPYEMTVLYINARAAACKQGDFAEVGVFRGGSARILCEVKGDKPLHLFDTFKGLPETESIDSGLIKGQFSCSLESVQEYLNGFKNVHYHKGRFPETARAVEKNTFAFVHLDADLYKVMLEGLQFFYPRIVKGGIIISHDYSTLVGVRKVFDEFFANKPESVLELPTNQCMVVKA